VVSEKNGRWGPACMLVLAVVAAVVIALAGMPAAGLVPVVGPIWHRIAR
jgi:hypothetical protein